MHQALNVNANGLEATRGVRLEIQEVRKKQSIILANARPGLHQSITALRSCQGRHRKANHCSMAIMAAPLLSHPGNYPVQTFLWVRHLPLALILGNTEDEDIASVTQTKRHRHASIP
jgi:hypothetical protein